MPYKFCFYPCSAPTANDGSIPFATTVASHTVTAHMGTGGDDAPDLISNSLLDDNSITVYLKYPVDSGVGTYHLTFVITLDSAAIMEFDYNHVVVTNV